MIASVLYQAGIGQIGKILAGMQEVDGGTRVRFGRTTQGQH